MRENFALDIKKSIYEKTQYPSNKGEFEKDKDDLNVKQSYFKLLI